ncbi:uncharacterized protein LOC121979487 [Zingiber officinale]|uniref:uncharacterized protein LOC121979487 n=1 Tax=Zingiber officinale TaxID=94328 RepID=UPI001C4B7760|nr:uncharacterized protein LOC121979487 [Zingiber officinale]
MLNVTRFLLKHRLSFPGYDESSNSLNRGNFFELLQWHSQQNEEVSKVVNQNALGNNQMISPTIQKDLTRACASKITLSVIEDIGNNVFSLMVDESRDISVKEQMRVALRYVNKRGQVTERFLAIVHVSDTSSHSLKDAIDALFVKHGLSLSRLKGQGYDGASNMRGGSCKRRDQLRQIEDDRIVAMLEGGEILIQVLEIICDDSSCFDGRGVAKSLIQKMENYEFVFMLHLMKMILRMAHELSLVLQQKDQNIVQAISLIKSVKDQFQIFREEGWYTITDKVNTFCELNEIPVPKMKDNCLIGGRSRRRRKVITNLHYYHVEIFYQDPNFSGIEDLGSFAQKIVETLKNQVYPLVYCLVEMTLVLPVATASVERVFSMMKTIKIDLGNRMGDEWMNGSLVVYIEKDIFSTIEMSKYYIVFKR